MEKEDVRQKLYGRMRVWELPDHYIIEPTEGVFGDILTVSRVDGSMKLVGSFSDSKTTKNIMWDDGHFSPLFTLLYFVLHRWASTSQLCTVTEVSYNIWHHWHAQTLDRQASFLQRPWLVWASGLVSCVCRFLFICHIGANNWWNLLGSSNLQSFID